MNPRRDGSNSTLQLLFPSPRTQLTLFRTLLPKDSMLSAAITLGVPESPMGHCTLWQTAKTQAAMECSTTETAAAFHRRRSMQPTTGWTLYSRTSVGTQFGWIGLVLFPVCPAQQFASGLYAVIGGLPGRISPMALPNSVSNVWVAHSVFLLGLTEKS